MSYSVQPHRRQPTRLRSPWDSPGKNTGVGCHFLLQCIKVKSESEVTQSCPTLSYPMDCSLPGSSIHRISQARVLEWGVISFSNQFLGRLIRSPGSPRRRKGSGSFKVEIGVWNSQEGGRDKLFLSTFLSLSQLHNSV